MDEKINREIDFIATRYKEGRFKKNEALRAIIPAKKGWWTPAKVAASAIILLAISASAAFLMTVRYSGNPAQEKTIVISDPSDKAREIRVIDFEDTPLPTVAKKVSEIYEVEVSGLPENASEITISLHYEGNVDDLIDSINEILDTNLRVKPQ